jgi:all-trans-retinol 13,14-reductase
MSYDVITIGSGLGGLLSSVLLARSGKKVLLLEQHGIPGGYCTSYTRKGFTFNVPSVLTHLHDSTSATLAELGFFDELRWTGIDRFARCVYPDQEVVIPANDLAGFEESLHHTFPAEGRAISRFFEDARKIQAAAAALHGPRTVLGLLRRLWAIPRLLRLMRTSFDTYMRRTTGNARLISVLGCLWAYGGLPPRQAPAGLILLMTGEILGHPIRFPADGFQSIADFLARKLVGFGGEIRYRTPVKRILLGQGRAEGVETAEGERLGSPVVVSNADTRRTFRDLVGLEHLDRELAAKARGHHHSASGVSLHLGTSIDLARHDLRYAEIFVHESAEDDEDGFFQRAMENQIAFDRDPIGFGLQAPSLLSPRLAPTGKHILHVLVLPVSRDYMNGWNRRDGRGGPEYREAKRALAEALVRKVERLVPGLSSSLCVSELASPFTFERYTGASEGAWYDGVMPVGSGRPSGGSKPRIAGLYLTGTKVFGGAGLPCALAGGVMTARSVLAVR